MRLLEGGSQAFCIYMSINLSGGDVRMTEHLFYAHNLGTIFEQVRSKAMAKHVRARFTFPADVAEQFLDIVSKRAQAERLAVFAQEYIACGCRQVLCCPCRVRAPRILFR